MEIQLEGENMRILLLYGFNVDSDVKIRILKNLDQSKAQPHLELQTIEDFTRRSSTKSGDAFDMIIIDAHGNYREKDQRRRHVVQIKKDGERLTLDLVKSCAVYSKKIMLYSCHAGALSKDLQGTSDLGDVEIVTLGGSKHPTSRCRLYPELEQRFLEHGSDGLCEFGANICPDTFGVRRANGDIFKVSSIKVFERDQLRRCLFQIKQDGEGAEGWWNLREKIEVFPQALSQSFKDAALTIADYRRKTVDTDYWLSLGANTSSEFFMLNDLLRDAGVGDATIFRSGTTDLYLIAKSGQTELLRRFLKIEGGEGRNPNHDSFLNPLLAAAKEGHADAVEVLLSELSASEVADSCKTLKNLTAGRQYRELKSEVRINLDIDCVDTADFLLPRVVEKENLEAVTTLVDFNSFIVDRCNKGQPTALMIAARKHNEEISDLILSKLSPDEMCRNLVRLIKANKQVAAEFLLLKVLSKIAEEQKEEASEEKDSNSITIILDAFKEKGWATYRAPQDGLLTSHSKKVTSSPVGVEYSTTA